MSWAAGVLIGSDGVEVRGWRLAARIYKPRWWGGASLSARKMVQLVYQTTEKRASGPKCPVTGKRIQGIPHLIPTQYKRSRLARNRRTVNRPYGGVLSGSVVPERIIRAFLIEAQKIVKKVLKIQKDKDKQVGMS